MADIQRKELELQMPARGLNTSVRGTFLDPNYVVACNNTRFSHGEAMTRPGLRDLPSPVQTLTGVPNGGHYFTLSDGTSQVVLFTDDRWYYYSTGTSLWTSFTGGAGPTGFNGSLTGTPSQPWTSTIFRDQLVFSNGEDGPFVWTGSGAATHLDGSDATGSNPTSCVPFRYCMTFADRVIAGHLDDSGTVNDRVRWCKITDLSVWDPSADATAGFADLIDLPGAITGMRPLANQGYIFKADGIIRMTETGLIAPSFTFQTAIDGIGCLEGRTLVEIDGRLIFLGRENVYAWDGASIPQAIGTPIRGELFSDLNRSRIRQCFAFHHSVANEYWLWIPIGTEDTPTVLDAWPSRAYIWNYIENSWGSVETHGLCSSFFKTGDDVIEIDEHDEDIDDWVTAIDSGLGGAEVTFPIVGRFDATDPVANGQATYLDDNLVGDQGVSYSTEFTTADTRFNRIPDGMSRAAVAPPMTVTVNRVMLALRHWASATIDISLSPDSGATWKSVGTKAIPGSADGGIKTVAFSCRITAAQARLRISSEEPIAIHRITYEYFDRGDLK